MSPGSGPARLVVVSGPSGSGKTTICKAVVDDKRVVFSVSATTRARRGPEVDGRDYWFLSEEEFEERVQAGAFLEHARYNDNRYGTLERPIRDTIAAGCIVILEIEVQGTRLLRETGVEGLYVFIMPPSLEELERRLRGRKTEDDATIERRLAIARREMDMAHLYDHVVINKDLDRAIEEVKQLIGIGQP